MAVTDLATAATDGRHCHFTLWAACRMQEGDFVRKVTNRIGSYCKRQKGFPFGNGRASLGRKNIFSSYPSNSTGTVTTGRAIAHQDLSLASHSEFPGLAKAFWPQLPAPPVPSLGP